MVRHELYMADGEGGASLVSVSEIPTPAPTADDVRRECQRRMMVLVGARDGDDLSVKLSNGSREAIRLNTIRSGIPGVIDARTWTDVEAALAAALWAIECETERLRACSNAMEGSPPADYTSDIRW